ncbi:winged helix-turn-helix domain-containing protein [Rummeliibacillus suwonensis]|uniref:winged helix-turn-helix domain-containing protein n=1 Tax=Rummeliibacillus suwonensis TaxID=1306154 RepID=UPI001AAEF006|nr:winged helix-turn-helix domain-containing protein [Rummeliibacillus suwonensis]MBO2537748.1 winged helix-turn-helix transcriptional regulator [Rummeliibacillus suwonensis]
MDEINNFGKLLFDKKVMKILEVTKEQGLTIKEIAEKINESPSSLYYPVKKMMDAKALIIVKEEKVKNLLEYYYSSKHLYMNGNLSFEGDMLALNYEEIIQQTLFEVNRAISNLKDDVMKYTRDSNHHECTAELNLATKKLSYKDWKTLNQQIRELIENFEETDKDGEKYNLILASYKSTGNS